MAEKGAGTAGNTRLITVLCLAVTLFALAAGISLSVKNSTLAVQKEELVSERDRLAEEKKQTEAVLEQLTQEKADWERMKELAEESKAHFFELAGQLEQKVKNDELDVKIAYLTFDDGPYINTTPSFLDVLDQYGVLATFFQRGRSWDNDWDMYKDIFLRIKKSGHTLANHTWSHGIKTGLYSSTSRFIEEVLKQRQFIEEHLGVTSTVMRFPGGSSQARGLKQPIIEELRKLGYGYVDWDTSTGDGKLVLPPDQFRDNVLNDTGNRSFLVVLMHDYSENTCKALPEIIEGLQKQGYIFLPLWHDSVKVMK